MGLSERELELVKSTWALVAKDTQAAGLAIFKQYVCLRVFLYFRTLF